MGFQEQGCGCVYNQLDYSTCELANSAAQT